MDRLTKPYQVGGINSVTAPPSLHDTPRRYPKKMTLRTIATLFLVAMTIPAYSDESKDAKSAFWPWFQTRESEFAKLFSYETGAAAQDDPKLQKKIEDTVGEVGAKLRSVHPEFSPFFGFSGGSNEMIITVHGQAEHFKAVDDFVDSAPEIKGWKFVALKKPLSLGADTDARCQTNSCHRLA